MRTPNTLSAQFNTWSMGGHCLADCVFFCRSRKGKVMQDVTNITVSLYMYHSYKNIMSNDSRYVNMIWDYLVSFGWMIFWIKGFYQISEKNSLLLFLFQEGFELSLFLNHPSLQAFMSFQSLLPPLDSSGFWKVGPSQPSRWTLHGKNLSRLLQLFVRDGYPSLKLTVRTWKNDSPQKETHLNQPPGFQVRFVSFRVVDA